MPKAGSPGNYINLWN